MSIEGVKPGVCAGVEAGKTLAEKIGENKMKLGAAIMAPGLIAAGITKDTWDKADENAKEGVKMAAVLAAVVAGAAFLTGKANGQKGVKALTEGAKALWNPIKEGFGKVKGEVKTKALESVKKLKASATKLGGEAKEKAVKLYDAAKGQAEKIATKVKTLFTKTAKA